ncbi:hypothetical protein Tco_0792538 [Tanacetum coccineum]
MKNANPCVKTLTCEPSCLEGEPEFLMMFKEEELEEEIEEEFEEEEKKDDLEYLNTFPTKEELDYHEYLLKNLRPSWVRAKIRKVNLSNIKIPCMIGYLLKEQTYIDLESPINIMSRLYYYWIMNVGLESRRKPSNPKYVSSVIDPYLGGMILGKSFVKKSKLIYDEEKGTVILDKESPEVLWIFTWTILG